MCRLTTTVMHTTNGFLEGSGLEDGSNRKTPFRYPATLDQSHRPEFSELNGRSVALRERIYGIEGKTEFAKHYVRKPRRCDNCPDFFTSKSSLREHMFQKHAY
jgi:hypothetical protein